MRSLALARLHYLTKVRTAPAALFVSLVLAVFPIVVSDAFLFGPTMEWRLMPSILYDRARNPVVAYLFHLVFLVVTCDLFGKSRFITEGIRVADLTETTPIKPGERFLGDAIGIFRSAGTIHVVTLPLLALSVALSPLPTSLFVWLEALVLAVLILASAAAAWKFRSAGKWARTQTARSMALFATLLIGIVMATTRWPVFRDEAFALLVAPSEVQLRSAAGAVMSGPLLVGLVSTLYLAYLAFYFVSSIRNQEKSHAL